MNLDTAGKRCQDDVVKKQGDSKMRLFIHVFTLVAVIVMMWLIGHQDDETLSKLMILTTAVLAATGFVLGLLFPGRDGK